MSGKSRDKPKKQQAKKSTVSDVKTPKANIKTNKDLPPEQAK